MKTSPANKKAGPSAASTRKAAVAGKASASKKRSAAGRKPVQRGPSVSRQAAPTSDRYKEIQQALASKGYLKSEPTGVWDADSAEAMKRFQTDRKLDPSGKLTAAALIDLGLGPKPEPSRAAVTGRGEAVPEPPKIETAPAPEP